MTARSVRLPEALIDAAEAKATDLDRSLSWMIRQALSLYLEARVPVSWPQDGTGGTATYRATLTWQMPPFATDDPSSDTELVIERMVTELCEVVRAHGAEDFITVDGPDQIIPMALRKTRRFPPAKPMTVLLAGSWDEVVEWCNLNDRNPHDPKLVVVTRAEDIGRVRGLDSPEIVKVGSYLRWWDQEIEDHLRIIDRRPTPPVTFNMEIGADFPTTVDALRRHARGEVGEALKKVLEEHGRQST